ncbi:hypothetical protein FA13DRAFT_383046 [Coprinellus micaceus]|uniref:Uncharacterized protein n=1 Tax=Coprinellus micaceus TaxID=71717 RepID=A0A4Y7SCP2_COPMI|nr:hypothetical protein FA13DRAFT_383046 [Coprinellus micaceus]
MVVPAVCVYTCERLGSPTSTALSFPFSFPFPLLLTPTNAAGGGGGTHSSRCPVVPDAHPSSCILVPVVGPSGSVLGTQLYILSNSPSCTLSNTGAALTSFPPFAEVIWTRARVLHPPLRQYLPRTIRRDNAHIQIKPLCPLPSPSPFPILLLPTHSNHIHPPRTQRPIIQEYIRPTCPRPTHPAHELRRGEERQRCHKLVFRSRPYPRPRVRVVVLLAIRRAIRGRFGGVCTASFTLRLQPKTFLPSPLPILLFFFFRLRLLPFLLHLLLLVIPLIFKSTTPTRLLTRRQGSRRNDLPPPHRRLRLPRLLRILRRDRKERVVKSIPIVRRTRVRRHHRVVRRSRCWCWCPSSSTPTTPTSTTSPSTVCLTSLSPCSSTTTRTLLSLLPPSFFLPFHPIPVPLPQLFPPL